MTLRQLTDRLELVGRMVSNAEIPVYINGTEVIIDNVELSQGNKGNYYVNINTKKNG